MIWGAKSGSRGGGHKDHDQSKDLHSWVGLIPKLAVKSNSLTDVCHNPALVLLYRMRTVCTPKRTPLNSMSQRWIDFLSTTVEYAGLKISTSNLKGKLKLKVSANSKTSYMVKNNDEKIIESFWKTSGKHHFEGDICEKTDLLQYSGISLTQFFAHFR